MSVNSSRQNQSLPLLIHHLLCESCRKKSKLEDADDVEDGVSQRETSHKQYPSSFANLLNPTKIMIVVLLSLLFLLFHLNLQATKSLSSTNDELVQLTLLSNHRNIQSFVDHSTLYFKHSAKTKPAPFKLIIAYYVYNRPSYFQQSLESLSRVKGIEDCLLIISHDSANEDMHQLVYNISFTKHVIQLHHPRTIDHKSGLLKLKDHWWWYIGEIFNKIVPVIKHAQSTHVEPYVLFLEEDHVVSSDLVSTAQGLISQLDSSCSHCWGFSLYAHDAVVDQPSADLLTTTIGRVGFPSTAYAFNSHFWNAFKLNEEEIWKCQDGWDVTTAYLQYWSSLPVAYLQSKISRVKNIGEEGLNVTPEIYKKIGLGTIKTSDDLYSQQTIHKVSWASAKIDAWEGFKEASTYIPTPFNGFKVESRASKSYKKMSWQEEYQQQMQQQTSQLVESIYTPTSDRKIKMKIPPVPGLSRRETCD